MIVKNSIRQLKRTPLKTTFFVLLLAAASAFFSLGGNLWSLNDSNRKQYENTFITIGTVEQRASAVQQVKRWDAELKEYHIYNRAEYNKALPLSVLDFEGANYIYNPEHRCYYGAYCPEYDNDTEKSYEFIIVEVSPLKDGIPDEHVQLQIKKVLLGAKSMEGSEIDFVSMEDPEPKKLYKDKTYLMSLYDYISQNESGGFDHVYVPWPEMNSAQVSATGEIIEDGIAEDYFGEEITEGFYETAIGKRWLTLIDSEELWADTIPVTATQNTNLLMSFYSGETYIYKGKDISEEEYGIGKKVCLISRKFARINNLEVGESIHLPLYYANYADSAGGDFRLKGGGAIYNVLNAKGEVYPVFEDSNYFITGIYDVSPGSMGGRYGIGNNEVIIPKSSIKNSDENNILDFRPMKGYNTSFQIANGQIENFLAAWKKYGTEELEITFYDRGYSQLQAGMNNMKSLSRIFSVAGLILVFLVIVFFCNMFITKQRKRTAIERSLGLSKKQCMRSLLSGILLLIVIGSVLGCSLGVLLTNKVSKETGYKSYYDYTYGNTALSSEKEDTKAMDSDLPTMVKVSLGMEGIILLIGISISFVMISSNLKKEPLELLATSGKE
ncbi:MAG: FtsX-like permease family protein [Mobilitalea sp.]